VLKTEECEADLVTAAAAGTKRSREPGESPDKPKHRSSLLMKENDLNFNIEVEEEDAFSIIKFDIKRYNKSKKSTKSIKMYL
jgi:hypothetical protein